MKFYKYYAGLRTDPLCSRLIKLIINECDIDIIEKHLEKYPEEINHQNTKGWTALMITARDGIRASNEKIVELLLKKGADPNLQDKKKMTALMMAAENSRTRSSDKVIELLLQNGANPDLIDDEFSTALLYAVENMNDKSTKETVILLLKHNASMYNICDNTVKYLKELKHNIELTEKNKELSEKNIELTKELNFYKTTLELHPDSSFVENLKMHFENLSKNQH